MKLFVPIVLFFQLFVFNINLTKAQTNAPISFFISMQDTAKQQFNVVLKMKITGQTDFIMPVWTTGYYQKMDFGKNVSNFTAKDKNGELLKWEKKDDDTWTVICEQPTEVILNYQVKANRAFVATSYLGADRAYIIPGGLMMYPDGKLKMASTIEIKPIINWTIATGLTAVDKAKHIYYAPDFDVLYDSPLLIGNLESLPQFKVRGVPHYFIGYKIGNFDRQAFINDLAKIVESAVNIIGDIPYKDYTFIAIGPGQGGIEHLNSTTISFNGSGLNTTAGKNQLYNFLAHEYFHHYNVKRIRPIELGPFDYKKGSRTNMLWVSEGLSVYYEYLVVKRAGLSTEEQLFKNLTNNILAYESKPGKLYQSLVQASYNTWSDGPFGRNEDEENKTISYYDKGPVVGMLLDFEIRNATNNQKSLDDVMRKMYQKYYQQLKRGFTEAEFRNETEKIAGKDLAALFNYTTTTNPLDYQKYLSYSGLSIDTVVQKSAMRYTGLQTRLKNDSLIVANVDFQSPAWQVGIRSKQVILKVDGKPANAQSIVDVTTEKKAGETVTLTILKEKAVKDIAVTLTNNYTRSFAIKRSENLTPLQLKILKSWLNE